VAGGFLGVDRVDALLVLVWLLFRDVTQTGKTELS